MEKSPKKRLSNGSLKFEEKVENRSKDSKESSEGLISNKKNFILKSALCQGENNNEYKSHSFSTKNKDNNNRFS